MFVAIKRFFNEQQDVFWLYPAAFFMSCFNGVYLVTFPFAIKNLGGGDSVLGLSSAANSLAYFAGCIVGRPILDRYNLKRVSITGSSGVMVFMAGLAGTVAFSQGIGRYLNVLALVVVLAGLLGFFTSMFWPPMMGWLSSGHDGPALNRRLSFFNVSWSIGLVASPYLAGLFTEHNVGLAILVAAVFAGLAFVFVRLVPIPVDSHIARTGNPVPAVIVREIAPSLKKFRWMAAISLITNFACLGLMRTQVALLFKENLGFGESQFGIFMTVMCFTNAIGFMAAGRTTGWHYVLWPFVLCQVIMLSATMALALSGQPGVFYIIAAFAGLAQAYLYVSHQFYAASASAKRSAAMAVHETLLSVAYIIGFLGGGYLAEFFGRGLAPYIFGSGLIAAGLAVQMFIWFYKPTRKECTYPSMTTNSAVADCSESNCCSGTAGLPK